MTTYHLHRVNLSQGQRMKLLSAIKNNSPLTIRLNNSDLTGNDSLMLTKRQINKLNKARSLGVGSDLSISKTQIRKVMKIGHGAPRMGLFPSMGVSVPKTKPKHTTTTNQPTQKRKEGGRIINDKDALSFRSPPIIGKWSDYNKFLKTGGLVLPKKKKLKTKKVKKPKFIKKPLSNIDLTIWCKYLEIRIKGIFSRDEHMQKNHSPCIINLDDYEGVGTHSVCCIPGHKKDTLWYFDSFGMHYPNEFKLRAEKDRIQKILYNNTQYQHIKSVLCGYYVLYFLHQALVHNKKYDDILMPLSMTDTMYNERFISNYFKNM